MDMAEANKSRKNKGYIKGSIGQRFMFLLQAVKAGAFVRFDTRISFFKRSICHGTIGHLSLDRKRPKGIERWSANRKCPKQNRTMQITHFYTNSGPQVLLMQSYAKAGDEVDCTLMGKL